MYGISNVEKFHFTYTRSYRLYVKTNYVTAHDDRCKVPFSGFRCLIQKYLLHKRKVYHIAIYRFRESIA